MKRPHPLTSLTLPPEMRLKILEHAHSYNGVEPKIDWFKISHYEPPRLSQPKKSDPEPPKPGHGRPIEVLLDVLSPTSKPSKPTSAQLPPSTLLQALEDADTDKPLWKPLDKVLEFQRTCRQIHTESKGMFWSTNSFVVDDKWGLYYFSRGLGRDRLRYLSCVGTRQNYRMYIGPPPESRGRWIGPVYHGRTGEETDRCMLGNHTFSPMSHIYFSRPGLEYQLMYNILNAVEYHRGKVDSRLEHQSQRSADSEGSARGEDGTAMAVTSSAGLRRDSIDILGEAIRFYHSQLEKRMEKGRRGWHIQFERFDYPEKPFRVTWLTKRAVPGTCQTHGPTDGPIMWLEQSAEEGDHRALAWYRTYHNAAETSRRELRRYSLLNRWESYARVL